MRTLEPISNASGPVPPKLMGRYAVTTLLGKGAQARVYLAWDSRLKQWRALKVLAAAHLDDEHIRSRFDGEAQMMAKLSHVNLLRVLDVAHDRNIPFMVMELARGGSIVDWMKRNGALPARLALEIAIQCCRGLEHSHAQGIVHRDVKPHNILVQEEDRVVLTDFGIARADDAVQLTADGAAMGTFAFMAPEQRSDAHNVDFRADIYALGASLFTMLTLRTSAELFFAETKDKILQGVPEIVQPVVVKACKYERDERYATMAELRAALEQALAELPPDEQALPMFQEVVPLPSEVPSVLPPDSGVEELVKMLVAVEDQPTTLAPRTGKTNPGDRSPEEMATFIPYQMPNLREARRKAPSFPPRARTTDHEEEEEVPDYIDQSTLPPPRAPEPVREVRPETVITIDQGAPKTPAPATPAPAKSKPPPVVQKPKDEDEAGWSFPWFRFLLLGFAMMLVLFMFSMFGLSYALKSSASADRQEANAALVNQVLQVQGIVENLATEGADEQKLQEAWFHFQDAKPEERAEAAVAFARLSVSEADRVGAHGKAGGQVHQIRTKLDEFEEADAHWKSRATSGIGRLTGSLGVY